MWVLYYVSHRCNNSTVVAELLNRTISTALRRNNNNSTPTVHQHQHDLSTLTMPSQALCLLLLIATTHAREYSVMVIVYSVMVIVYSVVVIVYSVVVVVIVQVIMRQIANNWRHTPYNALAYTCQCSGHCNFLFMFTVQEPGAQNLRSTKELVLANQATV